MKIACFGMLLCIWMIILPITSQLGYIDSRMLKQNELLEQLVENTNHAD